MLTNNRCSSRSRSRISIRQCLIVVAAEVEMVAEQAKVAAVEVVDINDVAKQFFQSLLHKVLTYYLRTLQKTNLAALTCSADFNFIITY